jgi:integrase/recombinase XerD
MTPLRRRMHEDMQLRGLAPRTQESYLAAIQQLARHYGASPDQLSEEGIRQYFLYLRNEKRVAPSTANVALNALKFIR